MSLHHSEHSHHAVIERGARAHRFRKHEHPFKKGLRRSTYGLLISFASITFIYALLAFSTPPERVERGMTFVPMYARELGLDWREAYLATLDDLGVRKLRLSAHWPTVEPSRDVYDFSELHYMLDEAQKRGAQAIISVGRRTPRWPECHTPQWAQDLSWDESKHEIREVVERTVLEFRDHPAVEMWQVENEPFLSVFADMHCGDSLDEEFLKEEIALVKELDPSRKILITDSGNLGTWWKPYRLGDAFGTSVYIYLWNPEIGPFKSIIPPSFYRAKLSLVELFFENKPSYLIELSIEPWLTKPVIETPLDVQFERMDMKKFEEILAFAEKTHFERQYLWGAEWWYWLKGKGHPEFWERGKEVFSE